VVNTQADWESACFGVNIVTGVAWGLKAFSVYHDDRQGEGHVVNVGLGGGL